MKPVKIDELSFEVVITKPKKTWRCYLLIHRVKSVETLAGLIGGYELHFCQDCGKHWYG